MKTFENQDSVNTVTGMFATGTDAEKAYQTLLDMGYKNGEITMIMSETAYQDLLRDRIGHNVHPTFVISGQGRISGIREAVRKHAKFISVPGLSFVLVGNLSGDALRTLSNTILSDEYAEYFQRSVRSGEILIDFGLHSAREKNLITNIWENFGGHPLVRRVSDAA